MSIGACLEIINLCGAHATPVAYLQAENLLIVYLPGGALGLLFFVEGLPLGIRAYFMYLLHCRVCTREDTDQKRKKSCEKRSVSGLPLCP